MKILTAAFLFTILAPLGLQAQFDDFSCKSGQALSESAGTNLIAEAQSWYNKINSLKGDFSQNSYLAALDIGETSSGSFWFKKRGLMRWTYVHPEAQDFIIRENTFWLYRPADSQVLVDDFKSILISDLPIAFLMGLGDLSRDFRFVEGCKRASGSMVKLSSRTKPAPGETLNELNTFALLLDAAGRATAAQIEDVSGNVTTITLKNISENQIIADQQFAADFPKGVDVYDRRQSESKNG